jgi:hypothetical protein
MFARIMAETEETLVTKIIQTPVAVLFGVAQSVNPFYERDLSELNAHSRKFRTYFDEVEIAVRRKIHDTFYAGLGYLVLAGMYIRDKIKK